MYVSHTIMMMTKMIITAKMTLIVVMALITELLVIGRNISFKIPLV